MTKQGGDFFRPVSAMELALFAGVPRAIALDFLLHADSQTRRQAQRVALRGRSDSSRIRENH